MDWLLVVGTAWLLLSVAAALLVGGVIGSADQQAVTVMRAYPTDDAVPVGIPLPRPPSAVNEPPATEPRVPATSREEPPTIPGLPVARPPLAPRAAPEQERTRSSRPA